MKTTKTVYVNGNRFGTQYAYRGCNGYASKWKVSIDTEKQRIIGIPKLLESNISIDEKIEQKIQDSNISLDRKLGY